MLMFTVLVMMEVVARVTFSKLLSGVCIAQGVGHSHLLPAQWPTNENVPGMRHWKLGSGLVGLLQPLHNLIEGQPLVV